MIRSGLLPLPPPLPDELTSEDGDENKGLWNHKLCKVLVDLLLFYTTAFFVLLATISVFALMFLVPFFIDPAWSTLQADFDEAGAVCTTTSGVYIEGRSNCEWSSCEEGCTKTIYTCWQIEVAYEMHVVVQPARRGSAVSDTESAAVGSSSATEAEGGRVGRGRLFPNVKGCGYPPRTVCKDFTDEFALNGTTFECFVSRADPGLVIVNLDLDQVTRELLYSLIIPLPCLFVSIVYILIAYFYIYRDPPEKSYRPVATLSTVSAMAALIDVTGGLGARGGGGGGGATSGAAADDGPSGSDDQSADGECEAAAHDADEGGGSGDDDADDVAEAADDDAVEEEHRNRLITEQKAQLLAAHNAVASSLSPIAVRSAVSSIGAMQQRERAASAQFSDGSQDTKAKILHRLSKMTPSEQEKKNAEDDARQHEKVQIYRREYGAEKYSIMQYYQWHGML